MNAVIEQINSMGRVFVDFARPMLVQSSVLIVILLLVDCLMRRRFRAVFRYWLWMLIITKLILPVSLSSPVSVGRFIGDSTTAISITAAKTHLDTVISEVQNQPPITTGTTESSPAMATPQIMSLTWQGGLLLIWLVAFFVLLLLLLQRALFVCGLVRQAAESNDLMKDMLGFCCKTMRIRGQVGLKISPNATSPAVCGLWRPIILLPQGLGSNLSSSQLRVVLMHELAHIKRGDLWVNLLQTLLQIVYFYNPFLWLANSFIRRIREQAVDEMVQVALGERAQQYPETLLNVARFAFERPVLSLRLIGVVESKTALTGRIKRLLNRPIPKTAKLGLIGAVIVLLIGAVLLPMATAEKPLTGHVEYSSDEAGRKEWEKRLENKVTVDADKSPDGEKLTVQFAVIAICKAAGVPYCWEKSAKLEEPQRRRFIEPVHIKDTVARSAILDILRPVGLQYACDADGLYLCQAKSSDLMEIYEVNRTVSDLPQEDDFSTPESAYAAINRVSANGEQSAWQRVSIKELAEKFAKQGDKGKTGIEPEWAEVLLNAEILEVQICKGTNAAVFAKLPQEFSSKPIRSPIDVRYLKLEDGKWLNTGNDRVWTIEEARARFDNQCKNIGEEKADEDNEAVEKSAANIGPPIVVSTSPATFADDVSPDLNKLTVTFNQPMKDKAWAWVQWDAPFPETTGKPTYDDEMKTCTLPVKLKPGQAYLVAFNIEPYIGFVNTAGNPAKPYVLVFATKNKEGKPTSIPEEFLTKAKNVNQQSSETETEADEINSTPYTQIMYEDIQPDSVVLFKNTIRQVNRTGRAIKRTNFINSKFVDVKRMRDATGQSLKFTINDGGEVWEYDVEFNEPVGPGEVMEYSTEGRLTGLIHKVEGADKEYVYHFQHWPSAGEATRRVETYLLPAGAELLSNTPEDMERCTKDSRIELHVEKMIPPGGSITTSFRYRLP